MILKKFLGKRLAFTTKMRKLALTRQATSTKYQNTKSGKHYGDRKDHSKTKGSGFGMPYDRRM